MLVYITFWSVFVSVHVGVSLLRGCGCLKSRGTDVVEDRIPTVLVVETRLLDSMMSVVSVEEVTVRVGVGPG